MTCQNCGSENAQGTRFCVGCGSRLEEAAPPPAYQQPPQQTYQPPVYQSVPAADPTGLPMRTSQFFWMIFVLGLPLVGFICALVWAFSGGTNLNRRNLSRAMLLWQLIGVIAAIVIIILASIVGASLGDFSYYF